MRTLLKVRMDTQAANRAAEAGTMEKLLDTAVEMLRPEATYFCAEHGRRTAYFVFDLQEPGQIPSIAEPLFQEFDAEVDIQPVMNLDDLRTGFAALRGT